MNSIVLDKPPFDSQVVRIDAQGCRCLLPHRDCMALIDGVETYSPAARHLIAFKRIATNEFAVRGHFPRMPMFPPALVIEVLAQACGLMMNVERLVETHSIDPLRLDDPAYLQQLPEIPLSVLAESHIKQYAQALPGDTLIADCKLVLSRQDFRYFKVTARVDDVVIADGNILLSYPNYLEESH